MSTKKEARYIGLGTGAAMKLQLDPDIYNATIGTILGVAATTTATATVPVTLRQAAASSGASLLTVTCEKGTGDSLETRTVRLICDKDQVDTAKAENTGLKGKTLVLGGAVTANWTIKSVR